ncbi:M48 family metallopeptidase [Ningiella sp. W23]|uniref:M48 family metallopeptidase n=1 Tax=Ningiella sp. W23 TaxID=3023715 RepID=UPI00375664BF
MRIKKLFALVILLSLPIAHSKSANLSVTPRLDVNYKPELHTDEGGFWYKVEQLEFETQRSPHRVTDPLINDYLSQLVCNLAGEYCSSIRVYLIDNPHFNASVYPNGMMHVHTGLLLRLDNEAQLAAILGHEIGHFLMTHQLMRYRSARDSSALATFIDIGLAGLTGVYGLATLGMASANMSFSREHEYEADLIGIELMANIGYSPQEAARVWEQVKLEREADKSKEASSVFWSTHPPSKSRAKKLSEAAVKLVEQFPNAEILNQERYINQIKMIYADSMANHINLQEYEQTELLIAKHKSLGFPVGLTHFFAGELHRMRAQEGDAQKAIDFYLRAAESESTPQRLLNIWVTCI